MASHSKVYKYYVLYYDYVLFQNKMQLCIYQRVFLITSTLEISTVPSFVSYFLVPAFDLFSLRCHLLNYWLAATKFPAAEVGPIPSE